MNKCFAKDSEVVSVLLQLKKLIATGEIDHLRSLRDLINR